MPNFFTHLVQDCWPSILFAMAGGIVLSLGNLATQYTWAYVGLSVTEVITPIITVVIETSLKYFLDDQINRAEILFPGVACFLIAVCLGSAIHSSNAADNEKKLSGSSSYYKNKTSPVGEQELSKDFAAKDAPKDLENAVSDVSKSNLNVESKSWNCRVPHTARTAEFLIQLENRRSKFFKHVNVVLYALTNCVFLDEFTVFCVERKEEWDDNFFYFSARTTVPTSFLCIKKKSKKKKQRELRERKDVLWIKLL